MGEHVIDTHVNSKEIDDITTLQGGIHKRIKCGKEREAAAWINKELIEGPYFDA